MKKSKILNVFKIVFLKIHFLILLYVILFVLHCSHIVNIYELFKLSKIKCEFIYNIIVENKISSGILIGLFPWFIQKFIKTNQYNTSKIKTARASFENTRITILMCKRQLYIPYFEDWKIFFDKRKDDIETKVFENMNLWRAVHISLGKYGNFFTSWSQLNLYEQSWSESLSFVAKHNPEYLVTFHRAYESLQDLKCEILKRNDLIKQYKENEIYSGNVSVDQQEKYYREVQKFIWGHQDFVVSIERFIDQSLALNQLSIMHLIDYESRYHWIRTCLGFKSLFNFEMKTNLENLMPDMKKELGEYIRQINKSNKNIYVKILEILIYCYYYNLVIFAIFSNYE